MGEKERPRWKRWGLRALVATPLLGIFMWFAVHHIPGVGPAVANSLRAAFGNEFVAWLEDTVYGVEDWVNRQTKADAPPEPLWEVPSASSPRPTTVVASAAPAEAAAPPFRPADVGPVHETFATPGDGRWVPFSEPRTPDDTSYAVKTFLHPDAGRSWAVVAVVAFDLSRVELHPVAGRYEPKSKTPEAKDYQRPAVVPKSDYGRLIAAFNGGYKSTHGTYGMKIDGVTLVPGRPLACTIARDASGALLIRPWETIRERAADFAWFRQTPICMYDEGTAHPALSVKTVTWGASSVSKTTVIRRSAIGLDENRKVLFVGIGDHVTGKAIAEAMSHAGAHYVAQLDVNFSFPKFLLYDWANAENTALKAIPLTERFEYEPDQYVGTRSQRDFFYLTRRAQP
ncbi:MAG: hypothetical protein AAGA56_24525 [Myxococcota bacterium]